MPMFHFHLRARGTIHRDPDGTDLPDVDAARAHSLAVVQELLLHSPDRTRHWSMRVENEKGEMEFEVFFADVDPSLERFAPQLRMTTSSTCRRLGALTETLCAVRATLVETRMLLARAQGKPQLVYSRRG